MTTKRLLAIFAIVLCTGIAWFTLAGAIQFRTTNADSELSAAVVKNWGPVLVQEPPVFTYEAPTPGLPPREIYPTSSKIDVSLAYEPKQKGLLWYRTYLADFHAEYRIKNPTPIAQTIYAAFSFPAADARYDAFTLTLGDKVTENPPVNGRIQQSLRLEPGQEVPLVVSYRAAGMNQWSYVLNKSPRVKQLQLAMKTNFAEINIPAGAESPTSRARDGEGWSLVWNYADVLGANAISMSMPSVTNPGEVAGRMTFFAPVSLLFFFSVLVVVGMKRGTNLHPMNYFFLAAGCFAFQLLFGYLADLVSIFWCFLISSSVSLLL
ncbi:MAG TPA: hypothetical protein VGH90_07885, partial [Chthoniobacteraceae bacterium]